MNRRMLFRGAGPLLVSLAAFGLAACADRRSDAFEPETAFSLQASPQQLRSAIVAQEGITDALMALPDVVGTGVGLTADGRPAIKVFLKTGSAVGLPASVSGFPVETQVTGEIFALPILAQQALKGPPPGKGKQPADHTARFRPVPLGVSTGHPAITACTVGTRLTNGSDVWVLSNNHCYAASNFLSCTPGPGYSCALGDPVIQPGTFDGGGTPADDIGNVVDYEPIVFSLTANNVIDAAIASTTAAQVLNETTNDCYGTPQTQTLVASVGMEVQKCGRTTGHTTGTITAINANVFVNYGGPGTTRFEGQIITTNMSAGGDSGSLLVAKSKGRDKADNLKPVGLLYAGSSTITIHNPIDAVLARFGLSVDGN